MPASSSGSIARPRELAGAVAARVPAAARDPFPDPVPFEDLLNAGTRGDRPA